MVRLCQSGSLDAFFVRGIQAAKTDVFHDRVREQVGILQNKPKFAAQVAFQYLADLFAQFAEVFTVPSHADEEAAVSLKGGLFDNPSWLILPCCRN